MLAFTAGTVVASAGGWAFLYAREHHPTPQADPEAVTLLSHGDYELFHIAGLALIAVGILLVLWAMYRGMRNEP